VSATGWYSIDAWRGGECIWFTTSTQRRGVASHVNHAVTDLEADLVYITRVQPDGTRTPIAQVTNALIWRWHGPASAQADLRAYVERTANS
jgi:hypothetical protein